MHPENDLATPNDKVQDGKNLDEIPPFGTNTINKSQKKKKLLLPEVIPSGDPSQFAMPIFLKEPSDTFLIKSKPATLHCRVAHALRVFFQCNSENVEPTNREDHVEPETGVRYTEASVDIHRDLVEEYFQEFHCACVAISGKGSVVSRHALVTNACKLSPLPTLALASMSQGTPFLTAKASSPTAPTVSRLSQLSLPGKIPSGFA